MSDMTVDEAIEIVNKALPYSEQATAWDTRSEETAIRFTWRGDRFRVAFPSLSVEQCERSMLSGTNIAIILESLLKRAHVAMREHKRGKP